MLGGRLTLGRFLGGFALALAVAGATCHPTPYSCYAWVRSTGLAWQPLPVFVGVVLLIGWVDRGGGACRNSGRLRA